MPGFAHASEHGISLAIDGVEASAQIGGTPSMSYYRCTGSDLGRHGNPTVATEPMFRPAVIGFIASHCGVMCCLCGELRHTPGYPTCPKFCDWITGFSGSSRRYFHFSMAPLCPSCNAKVLVLSHRWNGSEMGPYGQPLLADDVQFVSVLHLIARDKHFRSRVKKNADRFRNARFDPRRAGTLTGAA